jgi:uncharacterized YccA/Bax inhibitor family protein
MRSSNPVLTTNTFSGFGLVNETSTMTVRGTINKTAVLLLLLFLPAMWTWNLFRTNPEAVNVYLGVGMVAGFVLALITVFKKEWAPITAPMYAVAQGLFLGGISAAFQAAYPGIVLQAVSMTMATLLVMLVAYQTGWVRATESFKLGVVAATGGIALVYIVGLVLSFFGMNLSFLYGNGLFSILFSVFVVVIAALNFILDFDFIQQGARGGIPKYMEWYGAFALMVTIIWLYVEILRLISKLRSRN